MDLREMVRYRVAREDEGEREEQGPLGPAHERYQDRGQTVHEGVRARAEEAR
jgi:hypothetical protein